MQRQRNLSRAACTSKAAPFDYYPLMWKRRLYGTLGVAALAACGVAAPMGSTGPIAPHGVASVRLFDSQLGDVTPHIILVAGSTHRLEVRLYMPDGSQVTSVPGGVELGFAFTPAPYATSAAVAGQPLVRDVTPTATPGEFGQLTITLLFLADSTTTSFGPFQALVHPS